jgi:hypothetical protein
MQQLVKCLDGRHDPSAETFLLNLFEKSAALRVVKGDPSGQCLTELVADVLAIGTPKMRQTLIAALPKLSGWELRSAIVAAWATMPPNAFYTEFSPLLEGVGKRRSTTKESAKIDGAGHLRGLLASKPEEIYFEGKMVMHLRLDRDQDWREELPPLRELDPRWLDAAVDAQLVGLVCRLARTDHAGANEFLSAQLGRIKKPHEAQEILQTMVRIGHPSAVDAVIDALQRRAKETPSYSYYGYWYSPLVADLPRSALAKIEALLPTLPDKMVDGLMDSVLALKNKPE